ncbi:hypothetical protein AUTU_39850 (plasmid) [Aureibacter tunicatorum]|nr:hypothetical protein AUTU_39850 [Aureibacter tunicatorum]
MRFYGFCLLMLNIVFASCDKQMPAGFWKEFKPNLIVNEYSDQGPYGGKRVISWHFQRMRFLNMRKLMIGVWFILLSLKAEIPQLEIILERLI